MFNKNGSSNNTSLSCGNLQTFGACEKLDNYFRDQDALETNNNTYRVPFDRLNLKSMGKDCRYEKKSHTCALKLALFIHIEICNQKGF